MDAGGEPNAVAAAPQAGAIAAVEYFRFPSPSTDDDCDDLYGDFNLGFLPLPPLSPSPSSPPKTPSPGLSLQSPSPSPSPPPRRTPSPTPQREREPEPQPNPTQPPLPAPKQPTPQHQPAPKSPTPQHQPPLPAPKALVWRHQMPQREPGRVPAPSPTPTPAAALYIGDLPWWTTDAEVEAALASHGELRGIYFFADKATGKSRGHCRADFLHPAAAASAATALHGRTFDGHHCVASLSRPPGLHRPDADFDAPAPSPNPTLGRGGHPNSVTTARGNVAFLGDGSALGPMAPRPRAFPAMIGGGGGFPSVGECGSMPSMVASHVNPAYFAASRMAMGGAGTEMWHNQGMAGGFWGGQQPWNFGGCEMPWQQPGLQQHHRQAQQQYRNGDCGKMRSTGRERSGGRNNRDIGNVRGNPDRRQFGRAGGERPGEYNHGERDRHRENVFQKECQRERNCDERDRRGGEKRRYQEYTEHDDWQRRGRARSSQPRNSDDDDNPRRQSGDSDDDDYPRRRR